MLLHHQPRCIGGEEGTTINMDLFKSRRISSLLTWRHCLAAITLLIFVANLSTTNAQIDWDDDDDPVSTVAVEAVLGRTATLPCDIEPEAKDDRVYMVLWFRESAGKPLYSFDVRGRPFEKALYWSDTNSFGPRAYFVTTKQPAKLQVDNIQLDDEGVYRCRVDFQNSPTRNHRINLTVIVPPHQILVYDASGRDVAGAVGPLFEGDNIVLTCEVRGGRPEPIVTWMNGSQQLESGNGVSMGRHVTVNRLEVPHITRSALNNTYRCLASNTKLVQPVERSIRIDMLLKPTSVSLTNKQKVFSTGMQYNLTCIVEGSVPDTEIKWTQNNRPFKRGTLSTSHNNGKVISMLSFNPQPEDDGTQLKCEGSNPRLQNSALEDTLMLNVMYPPQVTLSLGSTLRPDDIKEGDDVYFECHIKANPKEHRITWSHNGFPVTQNVSWGIIISTRSLVLQRVARIHAGLYACSAANDRGETTSAMVNLRIRYAPVCSTNTLVVIGASLEEAVPIPCRVNSDPPEIEFEWTFSSSGEHFEVPSAHYATIQETTTTTGDIHRTIVESNDTHFETYETVSELIYTPKGERDYGTLACWAKNSIGKQSEPCLFQVVPAAKPGALRNCTLRPYVVTSASLNSSNQTTMHANQMMMPTQYGRHETNFPHMEYVRERHNNNNNNNNNKNMKQQQQHNKHLPMNPNTNNNGNHLSSGHNKIYNEASSNVNGQTGGNSNSNIKGTKGKSTPLTNNAGSMATGGANNKRTTNNINQKQQQQQPHYPSSIYKQHMIQQKYRLPLTPQQMQLIKKRVTFTPSLALPGLKHQQPQDKTKPAKSLPSTQQQQQQQQPQYRTKKNKIVNKQQQQQYAKHSDSSSSKTATDTAAAIKTRGPQAAALTASKAFINNQSDGLSLSASPTMAASRTKTTIIAPAKDEETRRAASEGGVGGSGKNKVDINTGNAAIKKKLRMKRDAVVVTAAPSLAIDAAVPINIKTNNNAKNLKLLDDNLVGVVVADDDVATPTKNYQRQHKMSPSSKTAARTKQAHRQHQLQWPKTKVAKNAADAALENKEKSNLSLQRLEKLPKKNHHNTMSASKKVQLPTTNGKKGKDKQHSRDKTAAKAIHHREQQQHHQKTEVAPNGKSATRKQMSSTETKGIESKHQQQHKNNKKLLIRLAKRDVSNNFPKMKQQLVIHHQQQQQEHQQHDDGSKAKLQGGPTATTTTAKTFYSQRLVKPTADNANEYGLQEIALEAANHHDTDDDAESEAEADTVADVATNTNSIETNDKKRIRKSLTQHDNNKELFYAQMLEEDNDGNKPGHNKTKKILSSNNVASINSSSNSADNLAMKIMLQKNAALTQKRPLKVQKPPNQPEITNQLSKPAEHQQQQQKQDEDDAMPLESIKSYDELNSKESLAAGEQTGNKEDVGSAAYQSSDDQTLESVDIFENNILEYQKKYQQQDSTNNNNSLSTLEEENEGDEVALALEENPQEDDANNDADADADDENDEDDVDAMHDLMDDDEDVALEEEEDMVNVDGDGDISDDDLLAEMVEDYSMNDSKVLDEVISSLDMALKDKQNNKNNNSYSTPASVEHAAKKQTHYLASAPKIESHSANSFLENSEVDNNNAIDDIANSIDDADADVDADDDDDDDDTHNEPHFDYSRMEYSFHNGIATHSLVGPYGSGSGDMVGGMANAMIGGMGLGAGGGGGGGTINFDNYDNIIYSTMELECMPGYDGGLQQHYFLEAYDSKTKKLRLNTSSTYADVPIFRIDLSDLTPMDYYPDPNPALHLVVYSVNQKGRSEAIVLENVPINEAEKRSDGRMGLSILPIAALLTGTLFTVGIAVLFVVVVAVRKRRCQGGRNMCDDKDKHLGMDVTVTAPLETGPGHQRLVVAYTLKQGIEKQPDILSAQKNTTGSVTSSPLGNRPSGGGIFIDTNTSNGGVGSKASNYTGNGGVVGVGNNSTTGNYDSPTLNYNDTSTTDPLQQQLNSPPSQSSTLKLGSDSNRKPYQTPPLLYDALNRHDISRYDPLPLAMNYGGSNTTLSSGGSAGNHSLTNNATTSLMQNAALSNGHYTNHHHTLPHPSSMAMQHQQQQQQQQQHQPASTHHNMGTEKLSIADYLTASSLIDYNLSKAATGMLGTASVTGAGGGGGGGSIGSSTGSSASILGHMTLPKGLGLGSIMGAGSQQSAGPAAVASPAAATTSPNTSITPSTSSNLAITQKTNTNRNHIITDTLPGPESCV
ncbi:uncharacterized protein LOC106091693 isoform X2 [Stomoxys calcitrans]|uniref:uncharacterized protein LOC106091693 isoform X2 n=1 Tax=Stomoxys calcitrans TaxID=35570 RepID=UPI0027E2C8AB|nr:uncharacterized protein LOC106091693 isoform X2 [Stomoxys calcitrans]